MNNKTALSSAICLALLSQSNISNAQVLEEILVTAQKREQNLQDVPLSVNAVAGDFLEAISIDKIDDLQDYVPNLTITETGISTQMFVRGIGSGNNQGFEQSVVQYVDGVSHARQQLSRAPFFDMERIEVLRGPQNIIFGKNAVAGALNMITAKPTEETERSISIEAGEHGILEIQAIASGPLSDKLNGRIAIRSYEEDGYFRNSNTGSEEPEREDLTIRGTLDYTVDDSTNVMIKFERNEFETKGRQIDIIGDTLFGPTLGALGLPQAIPEANLDYVRPANDGDSSDNEMDNLTLTFDKQLSNGLSFTSITSYMSYEYLDLCDCDFIGATIFDVLLDEEYDQFSQEFRIASDEGNDFSWQAGLYYQNSDMQLIDAIIVPRNSILAILNTNLLGTTATRTFNQESDLFSAFFQGTWQLDDNWSATLGARWSTEDKDADRVLNIIDNATQSITSNPIAPLVYLGGFAIQNEQAPGGHNLSDDRSESSFSPSVTIQYKADDDTMYYASIMRGFKAGGFDARANNTRSFEFEEEEPTSFELGMKTTYADGRGDLNLAIYYTDYEDLQVSQFDGVLGFNVGNARKTIVQGLELDGRFAATEALTIGYAFAYLDHEYDDFENGNCYAFQPDPEGDGICSYTGLTGQYAPEIQANLRADYDIPLDSGLNLRLTANVNFVDEQNVHQNLDPIWEIDSTTKVDVGATLSGERWSLALLGRNVTDEEVITYAGNTPLSETFGSNTVYGFIAPPATWTLRATYKF